MCITRMIVSGLAGAAALTLAHQAVKKAVPDAPRMDVLGMRSIEHLCARFGVEPPRGNALFKSALLGDILSNGLYYSAVGSSRGLPALGKGLSMGLAAGLGAVKLPELMGLGAEPSARTPKTAAYTVGLYVVGGLAAAIAAQLVPGRD